jgi:hypothetical protein
MKNRRNTLRKLITIGIIFCTYFIFTGLITSGDEPGSMIIKKCQDFKITGDGSDNTWNRAEWINLIQQGSERTGYNTKVKVLYSGTGIYFLFYCNDENLTTTMAADNMDLWKEDVCEIFLWTEETFPVYFEYEISPMNYELPIMVPNYKGSFLGWLPWHYEGDKKTQHATSVVGGKKESNSSVSAWIAEIYIPYKLLAPLPKVPPVSGTKWRANMYRIDHDNGQIRFMWQPVTRNFHDYEKFGTFIFE